MIETPYRDVRFFSSSDNMEMSQSTPRKPPSNDALTLYVKRVPKNMDSDGIKHLFVAHGRVVKVRLDVNDNFPTNRAYVEMSSEAECKAAIKELDGFEDGLGGKIFVDYNKSYSQQSHRHPSPQSYNTMPGYGAGAGRGNTLLMAANNPPRMRPSRMHQQQHRPYNQQHTGQFSVRGPGPRGPRGPRGQFRPRYDMYRPRYGGQYYNSPRYPPQQFRPRANSPNQRYSPRNHQVSQTSPKAAQTSPRVAEESAPCLHCKTSTPLRCSGCKKAPYCSKECQTAHWDISHKRDCQQMRGQTTPSVSDLDMSQFSVSINPHVIEAMKEMPTVMEALESLRAKRDSDTDSVSSGRSEDPGLPLNELLQMKLNDFISPSQFFVQRTDEQTPGALPRVWECAVHGIAPSGGGSKWSDRAIEVCSSAGLALGGLCKVLCYCKKNNVHQTKVVLRNGAELAESLISGGVAKPLGETKHKVAGSLHSKLEPGQSIQLVIDISSIKGVTEFYAQVTHKSCMSELTEFTQMQPKLTNYATHIANKPTAGYNPDTYRAEEGDYVLAPYESEWFRGLVTVSNDERAVVAFIDYGNIDVIIQSQLIPLPRQFTVPPALAVLCSLHGLSEAANSESQLKSVEIIKSLAASSEKVAVTVRSVTEAYLTIDLFDPDNKNIAGVLLKSNYACPLSPSASTERTLPANETPAAASVDSEGAGDMPPLVTDSDMPTLLPTNDIAPSLKVSSDGMPSLSPAHTATPPNVSTTEDMPPLLSTNGDMPPLLSSNEDMPPLLSTNEDMPPLLSTNEDMPPLLSTNEDMPPLAPPTSTRTENSPTNKSEDSLSRQKSSAQAAVTNHPNRTVIYEKDIPALNLEISESEQTAVLLLSATDLHSIYVTSADRDSLHHFLGSMGTITQQWLSDSSQPALACPLLEGEVLFALEPQSEEWDRVVVLNYRPNQPNVRVRSIDFGASYDIDIRSMREMNKQGALLVARAVHATLVGVNGTLNAGGMNILSALVERRVMISGSKVKSQLMCQLLSEDGQNINQLLKSHVTSSVNPNGLDSHGSSSDGSLPAISSSTAGGNAESAIVCMERQINDSREVIKLLQGQIALLKQKPVKKSKPRKKVDETVEEFTL